MKKFTKLLSVVLAMMLCFSLCACGSTASSNGGSENAPADAGKTDAPKTLEVWFPATASDGNDAELWGEIVADWEAENNTDVVFQFISWKDYDAKYASGISTGTGPDVGYMYVEMFPTFIDAGAVEDLGSYLTEEDRNSYTCLTEKYQIFGKHYGIATSGVSACHSMLVNMDIVNSVGETMPENWDDVLRIAQKATQDLDGDGKIDQFGISQGWGQTFYQDLNWNWYSFLYQHGGDVFDKITGECILDEEAGVTTAQMLYDLKNTYKVLPEDTMSLTNSEAFENYFLSGKAAIAFVTCGTGTLKQLEQAGFDYEISITLQGPNGDQGFWASADQYTLMSAAEDKDLAWSFIRYITRGDGAEKAAKMKNGAPAFKGADFYYGAEETRELMQAHGAECARPLTAARRSLEVYDYLWKSLQGMMNGASSPADTMADVAAFANSLEYADPNA